MKIQRTIEAKLKDTFDASILQIENESHKHSVPANSETHFKVTMVSSEFAGQMKVKRHQTIYKVLSEELEMAGGVHALALHLYSPEEWEATGQEAPASPNCMGGSKADMQPAASSAQKTSSENQGGEHL
ncbi:MULTISPECIES: BolA family transcriptional regulator [unclassified Marinobacter]|uniref:BolA family protein n=1 Tax=unclassified Marinobacter TaxID=83889 RepID=UPI0026E25C1A|nr:MULTISPECIES: BolA/IbaG family iron-sulfur metabolism protein [unclassified Marinobacter]MDO6443628.1 BolA/IbaG family iron-sulfur metabolism protein [Marinobacter sp. 2_MG-2023]MDO6825481.1 BolA/IbaG family iron-sulfur metabolism protein [Marinobacter sp. 1_MG-2023]